MNDVEAWNEIISIPTYEAGIPEKYPIFSEKRVYQASSGVVYPYPIIEYISDEKVDKEWDVVFMENEYLKIMIIPSLGGRVHMAYDKIKQRHFVYYNSVIKPALVGLTGPWISGGIEFNWPQHHRPSTYLPIDHNIEEHADGSKTIWVSEVERMFRTKGMAGFKLYPDKAYLEINVQLYNRTPHPQTFLWWANPAVAVNEHYQSIFPPDVNAVFDHGKRDVSEFPIAKGTYYKVDYSPGTDISRYKNIPVPTSFMSANSNYDFIGGYENDTKAGVIHVANHHISPGKKQWTWGNGDFGKAWDRNLTDSDGPYIELMCGVYTDNQPDFSWMHPYEEKSFKQYFMPYSNVGAVKNATKEAMVNVELDANHATILIHATAHYADSVIKLSDDKGVIFEEHSDLSPVKGFEKKVQMEGPTEGPLSISVSDSEGKMLVEWTSKGDADSEMPKPATAAKKPEDIDSIERLFLQGLHLEQYRHATYNPTDYYLEALKREPGNVQNNNALGRWYLQRGQFEKALKHFENAIQSLITHNPNPYDGEPYFNKGLTLKLMGNLTEAYESFYKSCWNASWQDAGYFHLAQIDTMRKNFNEALDLIERSLIRNWHNHKARHLKMCVLRNVGRDEEALNLAVDSLAIDQFNFGVLFEKYLLTHDEQVLLEFKKLIRDDVHSYIEYALDYIQSGFYEEAITLMKVHTDGKQNIYPMAIYLIGWCYEFLNNLDEAKKQYALADKMPGDYCFPNRLEEMLILQSALAKNPELSNAPYYLGNFWFAARQYHEARISWENCLKNNNGHAGAHRNLALHYYNKEDNHALAKDHLEKAFEIDASARLIFELDQLYKKINVPVLERISLLEQNMELVVQRDDLYLEILTLFNMKGEYSKALKMLENRIFKPWEGGEGKVPFQYITSHIEIAKEQLFSGQIENCLAHLKSAQVYPENFGEGKLFGAQENDVIYWQGCTHEELDQMELARECWERASQGLDELRPAMFYNDQQADKIFYQGIAMLKLGQKANAVERFESLIAYGREYLNDKVEIDYFAISLPDLLIWEDDLQIRNKAHCNFLIGLGELGLGHIESAIKAFETTLKFDLYHQSAYLHLNLTKKLMYTDLNILQR